MDIIEQLQEIVSEETNINLNYDLTTEQWNIYDYLKKYCVGIEYAKKSHEIIEHLKSQYGQRFYDYTDRQLRKDIRKIRTTLTRRIGSSSNGYWLMTTFDEVEGNSTMIKLFVSISETLIQQGVDPKLLHSIIGSLAKKQGKEIDNQLTLKLTEHLREVIHTLSDDLKGN